jgi:sec-independent protein translocase protein TatA
MGLSFWQILIVLAVILLLFGARGKVSELMGDVAKGVKSFRRGLAEDDDEPASPRSIEQSTAEPVNRTTTDRTKTS